MAVRFFATPKSTAVSLNTRFKYGPTGVSPVGERFRTVNSKDQRKRGLDLIERVGELEKIVYKKGLAKQIELDLLKDRVDTLTHVVEALKRAIPHVRFD